MDLIAWAMVTKRAVYMIRMDCLVDVFEPFKTPYTTALKDASPSDKATVMVYTGDHFNSCSQTRGPLAPNGVVRSGQNLKVRVRVNVLFAIVCVLD